MDSVCGDLKTDMKTETSGQTATIVVDGRSNVHNESIATCLHVKKILRFIFCGVTIQEQWQGQLITAKK